MDSEGERVKWTPMFCRSVHPRETNDGYRLNLLVESFVRDVRTVASWRGDDAKDERLAGVDQIKPFTAADILANDLREFRAEKIESGDGEFLPKLRGESVEKINFEAAAKVRFDQHTNLIVADARFNTCNIDREGSIGTKVEILVDVEDAKRQARFKSAPCDPKIARDRTRAGNSSPKNFQLAEIAPDERLNGAATQA